jgi:muramoyltetrapeptide carboxypeptidase
MTGVARVWPAPLQPGDLVVAVAPSGPAAPDRVRQGISLLESWGLRALTAAHVSASHVSATHGSAAHVSASHVSATHGSAAHDVAAHAAPADDAVDHPGHPYLAADDADRAADLAGAWLDPEVRAVWAVRGGYGAQRMVDLLPWAEMRAVEPAWLVGFSDITALHTRLGRELEVVTLHAPGLASAEQLGDPDNVAGLRTLLTAAPSAGRVLTEGRALISGTASGELVGGNLSLLAADVGVEPSPQRPSVLLIEEVNEPAYRIDRMLTQLIRSGWLAGVTGVVLGDLGRPSDSLILERLARLDVPIMSGAGVGHGIRNLAQPFGARVRLEVRPAGGVLRLAG